MNEQQTQWLEAISQKITDILKEIEKGQSTADYVLGTRNVNQQEVQIKLVAEVTDSGPIKSPVKRSGRPSPIPKLPTEPEILKTPGRPSELNTVKPRRRRLRRRTAIP